MRLVDIYPKSFGKQKGELTTAVLENARAAVDECSSGLLDSFQGLKVVLDNKLAPNDLVVTVGVGLWRQLKQREKKEENDNTIRRISS